MCSQYRGKIDPSISSPSLQILPCSNARNRTLRHPPQTVPSCQCVTGQVDGKRPTHGLGGPGHKDGTPTTRPSDFSEPDFGGSFPSRRAANYQFNPVPDFAWLKSWSSSVQANVLKLLTS